jgi:hypothetical protein
MKISRRLLSSLTFRPFSKNDYFGFAGVESPVPLIAENEAEGILVIIDGDCAELYAFDVDGSFDLIDQCDDIRALPSESEVDKKIAQLKKELADLGA